MSDKKKIVEQLKKDFKKSQGGLGGLGYSALPMAHDKMFEKQADQIIKSRQPNFQPQYTSPTHIDMQKVMKEARIKAAQEREWDKREREKGMEFLKQCIPEISPYREAMIKFSKEGSIKDVKKWFKDGVKRNKELSRSSNLRYSHEAWRTIDFRLKKELGDAYITMGEWKKARKTYLEISKYLSSYFTNPLNKYSINFGKIWDWEITFDSIALLFMRVGDYDKTISLFKEALKKDFSVDLNIKSLREVHLGTALLAKGDIKKANKIFERVKILTAENTVLATKVTKIIDEAKMKYNS